VSLALADYASHPNEQASAKGRIEYRCIMSFEVLEQLEAKVQSAVDGISLLKMELDELRAQNQQLKEENQHLRNEHQAWHERLRSLLGKMDQMNSED